jgi:polysaccharide export outer membrane protein
MFKICSSCFLIVFSAIFAGCASVPTSGPSTDAIVDNKNYPVKVVELKNEVLQRALDVSSNDQFLSVFGDQQKLQKLVTSGDYVEVSVWEAPPATLFGSFTSTSTEAANNRVTILPESLIDNDGLLNVPFVGPVSTKNKTTAQLESEIKEKLNGKANQPQVTVRITKNQTSYATVVGEVVNSTRMVITPKGERVLDAIANSGGVKQPINKVVIQLSRGEKTQSLPLEQIILQPKQNITLLPGDIVTAVYQPFSFIALGASGKSDEINFEGKGISLAQAVARMGGVQDSRAHAAGVFLFRFERPDLVKLASDEQFPLVNNKVPVVYRLDLSDPNSFFVAQMFPVKDKDLIYVSNAPLAELQKFLNIVFSVTYPVINTINAIK